MKTPERKPGHWQSFNVSGRVPAADPGRRYLAERQAP
jgi:hypothetical protein